MDWVVNQWDSLQKKIQASRASSSAASSINFPFERPNRINDYVYQVHKPAGRPSIEIVFFHGLQLEGSKEAYLTTWLSAEGSELWLTWILKDFPDARILLVSYDAFAQRKNDQGRMDMYLTCENLVQSLTEGKAKVGGDGCPVILVGHSIGGLVVKELCVQLNSTVSKLSPHSPKEPVQNLLQNVKGLFYYACPHHGSRFADTSPDFPKGPLFECITTLNNEAQRRNEDFRKLHLKYGWKTYGIGEGRPTTLGQYEDFIVTEASARCDVDDYYTENADHFNICRAQSSDSSNFRLLSNFITSVLEQDQDRHSPKMSIPNGVYGLEKRVDAVMDILNRGARRLGIVGMGGIGKTTLAKAVYDSISGRFEYTCFLKEVKKSMANNDDLEYLKDKLMRSFFYKGCAVNDYFSWKTLKGKSVLIVLDDVEYEPQVQVMLESDGFSMESCVIVTSRESRFLLAENFEVYFVEELDQVDSKRILCLNAFGKEVAKPGYELRVAKFTKKCGGLPLALRVAGKYLHERKEGVWDEGLEKLRHAKPLNGCKEDGLWSVLKVCYESLAEEEQEMFLDVATCFHNQDLETVKRAWSVCGWASPESGLENLVDKGFVTIEENITIEAHSVPREGQIVRMHEVLRDLGRSIACPNTRNVATHTRLCYDLSTPLPATQLFSEGKPRQVKVLIIHRFEDINTQSLHGLEELRILWLEDVSLHGPLNFLPTNLAYMKITDSRLSIQPEGAHSGSMDTEASGERKKKRKIFRQHSALKRLEINACKLLEGSLDSLGQFQALEHLVVSCSCFQAPRRVLWKLRALRHFETTCCQDWEGLMNWLGQLKALHKIVIHSCIDHGYPIIDQLLLLESLTKRSLLQGVRQVHLPMYEDNVLEIIGWKSRVLPSNFVGLGRAKILLIKDFRELKALPNTLGTFQLLEDLKIVNCGSLEALPDTIGELKALQSLSVLSCKSLKSLPETISKLKALQSLSILSCNSLKSPLDTIGKLQALRYLLISCYSSKALPNELQELKALRLEITSCYCPDWQPLLATIQHLHGLQTLVTHRCKHGYASATDQLLFRESLTNRSLLQGFRQVQLPMYEDNVLEIIGWKSKVLPSNFVGLGRAKMLLIKDCPELKDLPDALGTFQLLEDLRIVNCGNLDALPDSIGELKALQSLSILSCSLKSPLDTIGKLQTLRYLLISCDSSKAPPNDLQELGASRLEISLCYCRDWQLLLATIQQVHGLQTLVIHRCIHRDASTKEQFDFLGSLTRKGLLQSLGQVDLPVFHEERVEIIGHDSEQLPTHFDRLGHASSLLIKDCRHLRSLPDTLGNLEALKYLYIGDCSSLEALPDSLGELRALVTFEIKSCRRLNSLPDTLGKLEVLRYLDIGDCSSLEALPDSVGELRALHTFRIKSCGNLKLLPDALRKLEKLQFIFVENCEALADVVQKAGQEIIV